MKNFKKVAAELGLTLEEVLEVLSLSYEDAEQEDLSVDEIYESLVDNGLEMWDADWGSDSCSNFIDA